jgi:hypothetical protein
VQESNASPAGADTATCEQSARRNVILDLSDGSLLAFSAALKLKAAGCSSIEVQSKETKFFSSLFFSQLAASNGLTDLLKVWDGDLAMLFASDESDDESQDDDVRSENGDGKDGPAASAVAHDGDSDSEAENDKENAKSKGVSEPIVVVRSILSECDYYQLRALPTWQAISFYLQVQALRREQALVFDPQCKVLPGKAFIRAAAVELPNLRNCHGLAKW